MNKEIFYRLSILIIILSHDFIDLTKEKPDSSMNVLLGLILLFNKDYKL